MAYNSEKNGGGRRNLWIWLSMLSSVCIILSILFFLYGRAKTEPVTMNVALYPYVPDQQRFKETIQEKWGERHPETALNFVSWDCYSEDPPDDLDVFVYDSIFLYDFLEKGYLLPLSDDDIRDADDVIPCALSACRSDGVLYAVPQLLCTNLLFARGDDEEIKNVKNINELYRDLGDFGDSGDPGDSGNADNSADPAGLPRGKEGLLLGIPDQVSLAFWYLEVQTDLEQEYNEWAVIPEADALNPEVMRILRELRDMTGGEQIAYVSPDKDSYFRGSLFAEGRGRALIGYSEFMYAMGAAAEDVCFHRISLADAPDIPMLYADIASVNAKIDDRKRALAVELLNLITGEEVLTQAICPSEEGQAPQYLLGARTGIYHALSGDIPIYAELEKVVSNPECRVFVVRTGGRAMIEAAGRTFAAWPPAAQAAKQPESGVLNSCEYGMIRKKETENRPLSPKRK